MPPFSPQPKPVSRVLVKRAKKASCVSKDHKESMKVKARSGGRCEVSTPTHGLAFPVRCTRFACHVHHMIGGRSRGRGLSALAQHKQHVCEDCHRGITGEIGGKRLIRRGDQVPLWTDCYRRVR